MDSAAEQRIEDRLERGLGEVKAILARLESKMDARHDKLDDRVRAVENRLYWFTGFGAAGGVLVGILLRKAGL